MKTVVMIIKTIVMTIKTISMTSKTIVMTMINNTFLSPMSKFSPLSLDLNRRSCTESVLTDTVLTVSSDVVFEKLSKLNPKKAVGPDGIPPWLLMENADLLAGSVTDILNCSYRECCLPHSWKEADVVAIPKEKSIQDINNHLRPVSLAPILSKLAEDFIVNRYLKPAVMERIDKRQFALMRHTCPHLHVTYLDQKYRRKWFYYPRYVV